MTTTTREAAYAALAAKVTGIPGLVTVTRRLKHWTDVAPEAQPAVYVQVGGESRDNVGRRLPQRVELAAALWLYVWVPEDQPVGPALNPLLDAIDAALDTPAGAETQTLGGAVHHCWIQGETQIAEGDLGNQAVAVIPVRILIT